jgi:polyisoprenoid-binding protein YceI
MGTPAAPSIPTTGTWNIDSVHSSVIFTLTHNVVATFRGSFHGVSGTLQDGVLSGEVAVSNLNVGLIDVFKEHLLGEAWFDGAKYPTISFSSTDIHNHPDGGVHAAGELTIRGVTKPVAISGTVTGPTSVELADGSTDERLGINLTTTVDRREFGMEAFAGADWDVTIEVTLQLAPAA